MDMPFGKFKGTPIEALEDGYLTWLNKAEGLFPPLRAAVDAEYTRRFGESGAPVPISRSSSYQPASEARGLSAREVRLLVDVLRNGFGVMISQQDDEDLSAELGALQEKCKKLTWSAR